MHQLKATGYSYYMHIVIGKVEEKRRSGVGEYGRKRGGGERERDSFTVPTASTVYTLEHKVTRNHQHFPQPHHAVPLLYTQ